MTAGEALALAGEALYGPRWQSDLARDIGVSDRTMRRWVAGTDTPRSGVIADVLGRVRARQAVLAGVEQRIGALLA